MGHPGREIERVWVLRAAPAIPADVPVEVWEIEQGYLAPVQAGVALGEEDLARIGFPEGRLRRVATPAGGERFFHTVKSGSGVVRVETEREITRARCRVFASLRPSVRGHACSNSARVGGLVWEIDVFHALPLVMVEVELDAVRGTIRMLESAVA